MMKKFVRAPFPILFAIAQLALITACSQPAPTATLVIGGHSLTVELAVTPAERERGLMFRTSLAEDHGMLFIFPYDEQLSFWMKNTLIPLSVAYVAQDGTIKEIHDMTPKSLDPIQSDHSVRYALEVNQGLFTKWGVGVGDRITLPQGLPAASQ